MGLDNPYSDERFATKTITFTGGAGAGLTASAITIFTCTGQVLVSRIVPTCTVDLVGAGSTLALGVVGSVALFIAATVGTTIDAGLIWTATGTPLVGVALPAALQNIVINANIIGTIAVADTTAGAIRFDVYYKPLSAGSGLV